VGRGIRCGQRDTRVAVRVSNSRMYFWSEEVKIPTLSQKTREGWDTQVFFFHYAFANDSISDIVVDELKQSCGYRGRDGR
jgi:hypothetical protein